MRQLIVWRTRVAVVGLAAAVGLASVGCGSDRRARMPNWLTLESAVFGSYGPGFIIGDMGNPVEPIEVPDSKVELLLCIVHGGRPFVYDDSWLGRRGKMVEHASLKLGTRSTVLVDVLLNDEDQVIVSSRPAPFFYVLEGDDARRLLEVCGMGKAGG